MPVRPLLALSALLPIAAFAPVAQAQDAAETAAVLTGSSGQARAQRSLGSAVARSIDRAAASISVPTARSGPARRSADRQPRQAAQPLPAGVDALEGTDAAAYKVGSGTTLKFSGRFTPGKRTECETNCAAAEPEPEEGAPK